MATDRIEQIFDIPGKFQRGAAVTGRVLFRLISYSIVVVNLLTFGMFLYVIAPYTSWFFFNDLRFWRYLGFFHKYTRYSAIYIWGLLCREPGLIITVLPLTSPPMGHPNPALFRISPNWNLPADSCGDCNRCCTFITRCCFLSTSGNRCLSYSSPFWRYFNCGRFPSSRTMLDYLKCPKFESIN